MALKEFKLPDIGEGIAEGEIVSWKVAAGQAVKEEDEFVEVMTDKATVTITVPFTGKIAELKAKEGDVVPVGSVIAVIDAGAAGGDAKAAAYLECAVDGRVLWGVGIHSSIVTASLKAVVSAVNRAQRG